MGKQLPGRLLAHRGTHAREPNVGSSAPSGPEPGSYRPRADRRSDTPRRLTLP
jgi:hypothetical protein